MSYLASTLFTFVGFSAAIVYILFTYSTNKSPIATGARDKNNEFFDKSADDNAADAYFSVDDLLLKAFGVATSLRLMYNFLSDIWDRTNDYCELRTAWLCSMVASLAVVSTGIIPAVLMPLDSGASLHYGAGATRLNRLLCFAVGSLLGDVFLHLLPETWNSNPSYLYIGLWVIAGLLLCFIIEKFCSKSESSQHRVAAMMNLIANIMDNFTHGLAVGGSFLVNIRFGILTTFAILVHEIPHEIGDFAILLRADFDRWSAIKAQLVTASGGILGATVALLANGFNVDQKVAWILPFTAGGFLNIALVQVLPDILKENRILESVKQLLLIFAGISAMGILNVVHR